MQQPRSSLLLEFTLRLDGEVHGPRPGGSVMSRRSAPILGSAGLAGLCVGLLVYGLAAAQSPQQPPPQGGTYTFRVVEQDFAKVRASDQAAKPAVMQRQRTLLAERDRKSTRLNSSYTVISYAVF